MKYSMLDKTEKMMARESMLAKMCRDAFFGDDKEKNKFAAALADKSALVRELSKHTFRKTEDGGIEVAS